MVMLYGVGTEEGEASRWGARNPKRTKVEAEVRVDLCVDELSNAVEPRDVFLRKVDEQGCASESASAVKRRGKGKNAPEPPCPAGAQ